MLSPVTELESDDPRYRAILINVNGCPVQVLPLQRRTMTRLWFSQSPR